MPRTSSAFRFDFFGNFTHIVADIGNHDTRTTRSEQQCGRLPCEYDHMVKKQHRQYRLRPSYRCQRQRQSPRLLDPSAAAMLCTAARVARTLLWHNVSHRHSHRPPSFLRFGHGATSAVLDGAPLQSKRRRTGSGCGLDLRFAALSFNHQLSPQRVRGRGVGASEM